MKRQEEEREMARRQHEADALYRTPQQPQPTQPTTPPTKLNMNGSLNGIVANTVDILIKPEEKVPKHMPMSFKHTESLSDNDPREQLR
jgi:hypothetical protein